MTGGETLYPRVRNEQTLAERASYLLDIGRFTTLATSDGARPCASTVNYVPLRDPTRLLWYSMRSVRDSRNIRIRNPSRSRMSDSGCVAGSQVKMHDYLIQCEPKFVRPQSDPHYKSRPYDPSPSYRKATFARRAARWVMGSRRATLRPQHSAALASYAFGAFGVPLWQMAIGAFIGSVPRAFVYTALGASIGDLSAPLAYTAIAVWCVTAIGGAFAAHHGYRSWRGRSGGAPERDGSEPAPEATP